MSYYNHIHDPKGIENTCEKCEKRFSWYEYGDDYPGGRDTEYIRCPYCQSDNGSIRTSGYVMVSKIEEN